VSVKRARRLWRNSTEADKELWPALRNRGLAGAKFCRQVPIGPYVCDFVCKEAKLVVEVDGGQHSEVVDRYRTRQPANRGYRVLRDWNNEVTSNMDGVLLTISDAVESRP
jgi:very-short-patch-repair endonuclease